MDYGTGDNRRSYCALRHELPSLFLLPALQKFLRRLPDRVRLPSRTLPELRNPNLFPSGFRRLLRRLRLISCPPLKRLNTRYQKAYGIQLTDNLTFIRSCGIDAFLIREARRWSCTYCGAIGCIHEKKCPGCGRESTERNLNMDFLLREWRPEDAISVARCADNEKIARNLRDVFPCPYTLQDAADYINSCIAADENRQLCRAIAVNGEAAGSIGLFLGGDVYRKSAELGYWLAEDYWGRGVMTAAVKQLCAEVFSRWDIARIYAEPFARNTGSRRVLEKAGFTLEGIMKKGVYKNGALEDYCMYALLRP